MARSSSANSGCLGLFVLLLPFFWVYDKCTGGDARRAEEAQRETDRRSNAHFAKLADERRKLDAEAERKALLAKAAADLREQKKAALAAWKPVQRVQALQACLKHDCPDGVPDAMALIEAAKTEPEKKQLRAVKTQIEAAQARAEKAAVRADASLRCCDGTDSPSCTCGQGSKRGCCSRHGGVCGCSAD
jgi:hypothetical protein